MLDLNGKNITNEGTSHAILVYGDLTINGEGTVDGGNGGNNQAIRVDANGNLTINGGTFTVGADANNSGNTTIYSSNGGNITITGGTFSSAAKFDGRYWVINKENGTTGVVAISGGKFYEFDPANPTTDDDVTYLADGYKSVKKGYYYEVICLITKVAAGDNEGFAAAAKNDNVTVKLAAGEYSLPNEIGDGIIIEGVEGTKIDCSKAVVYKKSKSFKLKNLTLKYPTSADYIGFEHSQSIKYENCVIEGRPTNYAKVAVFDNCIFNQTVYDYCIWTYAANGVEYNEITFNNCTFNCNGKAVKVYNEGACGSKVTFNGCTFTATNVPEKADKAAITINGTMLNNGKKFYIFANNCEVSGFPENPEFKGTSLWDVELKGGVGNTEITVDGVKVYSK